MSEAIARLKLRKSDVISGFGEHRRHRNQRISWVALFKHDRSRAATLLGRTYPTITTRYPRIRGEIIRIAASS
jgi:hypothetical protein